ncbi:MAG: hypothetical protein H6579_10580 [Chitinophagales bacterium]|nr:hypothetical protein [Chitinophagales bacterium]
MAAISLDIYQLIQRMNRTEKAYFKKFGYKYDKREKRLELLLFDIIDKELRRVVEVDLSLEDAVLTAAKKMLDIQSISKHKTNLYHDLLSALRDYEKSKLIDEKIFEYYQYSQILVKRNLFKEALAFIRKAENLARDHELFEWEIYMAHQHAVLLSRLDSSKNGKESVLKLEEVLSSLDYLNEIFEMEKHYFELVYLQKTKGVLSTEEDLSILDEKLQEINLNEASLSTRGRLYQLESLSTIQILKGNQQGSFEYYQQIINLLDTNPHLKKTNLQKYIILMEQYMQMSLLTMNLLDFEEKHNAFLAIACENELEQSWKDNADIFMLSIHAILARKLENFKELEQRFTELLERIPFLIPGYRKISTAYYMVSGFFMKNNFEKVKDWFYFIQNNRQVGVRRDVDLASRIMMLIACYETKDYMLMEYQLKAYRNFISVHGLHKVEDILSSFFGKLLKETDVLKRKKLYDNYLERLSNHFEEEPSELPFLGVFDIVAWLMAKTQNRQFYEVWSERNLA